MYFKTKRLLLQLSIPFLPMFPFSSCNRSTYVQQLRWRQASWINNNKGRVKICTCNKYRTYSNISHEHLHKLRKKSQKANVTDTAVSGMWKTFKKDKSGNKTIPEWSKRLRNKNYHLVTKSSFIQPILFRTTAQISQNFLITYFLHHTVHRIREILGTWNPRNTSS